MCKSSGSEVPLPLNLHKNISCRPSSRGVRGHPLTPEGRSHLACECSRRSPNPNPNQVPGRSVHPSVGCGQHPHGQAPSQQPCGHLPHTHTGSSQARAWGRELGWGAHPALYSCPSVPLSALLSVSVPLSLPQAPPHTLLVPSPALPSADFVSRGGAGKLRNRKLRPAVLTGACGRRSGPSVRAPHPPPGSSPPP